MTFRAKLFFVFTGALLVSVGVIVAGVTISARRAFDQLNARHTDALVQQFQNEFDRRKVEVVNAVNGVAEEDATVTMAMKLAKPGADISVFVNDENKSRKHGNSKFWISSEMTARLFLRTKRPPGSAIRSRG